MDVSEVPNELKVRQRGQDKKEEGMEEKQQDQPMGPNSSGGSRVKTSSG